MAKKHPGKYRVRAARHEAAARHSTGRKKEGHKLIAAGYRKIAAGGGSTHRVHRRKHHRKHKRRAVAAFGRGYRY